MRDERSYCTLEGAERNITNSEAHKVSKHNDYSYSDKASRITDQDQVQRWIQLEVPPSSGDGQVLPLAEERGGENRDTKYRNHRLLVC